MVMPFYGDLSSIDYFNQVLVIIVDQIIANTVESRRKLGHVSRLKLGRLFLG
jgi:hypothetical protein